MAYVIAKYAEDFYPTGKGPKSASVFGTYTAKECSIDTEVYDTLDRANLDLQKLKEFNPSVYYGVIEVEKED